MDLIASLAQTFDHAAKVISGVKSTQLDAPTPCPEWDVRTLLSHTIGVVDGMGRAVSGEERPAGKPAASLEADLGAQFRRVADATLAAWTARGLEGELNVGAGPMPAAAGISINLLDTATHSWDIAQATGQDSNLPDALAATVLAVCQGFITDELRGFAGFAPAVALPAGASATDQMVAFLGRRP